MINTSLRTVLGFIVLSCAAACNAQDLLVGEYVSNQIWRVAPDGTKTAFAQPVVPSGIRLCGFAFDAAGNLYAARLKGSNADGNDPNNGLLKITPAGVVSSLGGFVPGLPVDTAVDSAGNVYVSSLNGQIHRFSPEGEALGVFASVASDAYNIAFDSAGNLVVASNGSGEIRRFSSTGGDLGLFGTVASASSLAFDAIGDVYVGTNAGTIRRFSPSGSDLGQFAATSGALFDGLAFSPNGDLFATNYQLNSGSVERFSSNGTSLGTFSSGMSSPFGIGFVPSAVAVPEPSALLLFSMPLVTTVVYRRNRKGTD